MVLVETTERHECDVCRQSELTRGGREGRDAAFNLVELRVVGTDFEPRYWPEVCTECRERLAAGFTEVLRELGIVKQGALG